MLDGKPGKLQSKWTGILMHNHASFAAVHDSKKYWEADISDLPCPSAAA
jgi:hypothetical protein